MSIILKIIANLIGGSMRKNANKKRSSQVDAVVEEMGFECLPQVDMLRELEGTDLTFNKSQNSGCSNCFGGEVNGVGFKVFEFNFVTGFGKRQELHRQSVALIDLRLAALPEFEVKGKEFLSKFLGQPSNSFDIGDPIFAKQFWTCSAEPPQARMLFNNEVKATIHANGWNVESSKGRLLVYRAGKVVAPARLQDFVTSSLKFVDCLIDAKLNPAPYLVEQFESIGS